MRVITQATTHNIWGGSSDSIAGPKSFYVYDGSDVALTIVKNGATWFVRSRYLSGGVDAPLAGRFRSNISGVTKNLALVVDWQGTPMSAMKFDGTQESDATFLARTTFGSYETSIGVIGGMTLETGYAGASAPNVAGGFVYLRNRWYDPKTGRFLTQDPIGLAGGVNLYSYAGGNPVAFADPFGLDTVEVQVHEVKVGVATRKFHASIRITPNNQEKWKSDPRFSQRDAQGRAYVTLGAAIGGTGQLVSNLNRDTDKQPQQAASAVVPTPGGEDPAIERLLTQDAHYNDNLPYALFPVSNALAYNSNSYVAGMLGAAGLHRPGFGLPMPGYTHPVPASAFGVP